MRDRVGRLAGATGEGVAQELGAVLALDRGDGLLLGDRQRRDRGGPLEQVHVGGGQRTLGREGAEQAVVGGARDDLDEGPVAARRAGVARARPARSRRGGDRCGRSSPARGCARPRPAPPAMARTRPSVVVTTAAPPKKPATASPSSASAPPASTIRTSTRCTSSSRSSSAACRSTICSSARTRARGSPGSASRSTAEPPALSGLDGKVCASPGRSLATMTIRSL